MTAIAGGGVVQIPEDTGTVLVCTSCGLPIAAASRGTFDPAPDSDNGTVRVKLLDRCSASIDQLRSHRRGCTCDQCCQARGFLERMKQLIAELSPAGEEQ